MKYGKFTEKISELINEYTKDLNVKVTVDVNVNFKFSWEVNMAKKIIISFLGSCIWSLVMCIPIYYVIILLFDYKSDIETLQWILLIIGFILGMLIDYGVLKQKLSVIKIWY